LILFGSLLGGLDFLFLLPLDLPLGFVIDTQVAVLAQALRVHGLVSVACGRFLSPSHLMIAIVTHAVRVVLCVNVRAHCDLQALLPGPPLFRLGLIRIFVIDF
jgi:hypothetical protein